MADLSLAAAFPPASRKDWLALVERTLKGTPYERLVSRTRDGLAIEPIYERAAGAGAIAGRPAGTPWTVMQRVDHPDAAAANAEALEDLKNGATGLALLMAGPPAANGYGLAEIDASTFDRALAEIDLAAIAIHLEAGSRDLEAAATILALATKRGTAADKLDLSLGFDPLGTLASAGMLAEPADAALTRRARFAAELVRGGFRGQAFLADGRAVHDAGGSEAQELAFVLAAAVAYWRALEAAGVDLDAARRQIAFMLAADADQFLSLAKFRTARKLWARVEEAAGHAPRPIRLHAETAWRMTTERDPYENWLRATVAAFAAGLGGADSIRVLPHSAALGLPDHFARRIARNTQLILLEETNLHRVADPGAGAGAIEDLTEKLAAAAWKQFQEIEKAGGLAAALASGLIQRAVAAVREARARDVADRTEPITGTSEFPDLNETPATVLHVPRPAVPAINPKIKVEALPRIRIAEPFERLRDAADAEAAKGKRPQIFLANLGMAVEFGERAMFAKSLFEAGGIEAIGNDGFASVKEMAEAFKGSGASLACLSASDARLAAEGETAARALKDAGAKLVFVAGQPKNAVAGTEPAHAGADAVAALNRAHATLGIKPVARDS
jgi:methylmalonyl-CoA mutase